MCTLGTTTCLSLLSTFLFLDSWCFLNFLEHLTLPTIRLQAVLFFVSNSFQLIYPSLLHPLEFRSFIRNSWLEFPYLEALSQKKKRISVFGHLSTILVAMHRPSSTRSFFSFVRRCCYWGSLYYMCIKFHGGIHNQATRTTWDGTAERTFSSSPHFTYFYRPVRWFYSSLSIEKKNSTNHPCSKSILVVVVVFVTICFPEAVQASPRNNLHTYSNDTFHKTNFECH